LLVLGATILLLMHTRIVTPASARPRTILAIGAHPDDLEIACGGSLAMLVDAGHHVHGLVMTAGAVGGDPLRRPREAREGAHFLGLASLTVHDLPDTNLALTENRMVELMEQAINRFSPDIILTHSVHDQHQDHLAVHHATLRAARRHHSILCYESPSVTRDFNPDVFLDVGDYTDIKFQAVLAHRDQVGKSYMSRDVLASVTRFRGQQAKRSHAEAFESVRLLVNETGVL
ncbi:MAG: PIG-L deacetylase family protein, partial [Propionibacteriaceae bacterium]|nr:PIG-L deacetylase family protein [Propionibacteriaceae bacterium]